jgi:hypothetical protein
MRHRIGLVAQGRLLRTCHVLGALGWLDVNDGMAGQCCST